MLEMNSKFTVQITNSLGALPSDPKDILVLSNREGKRREETGMS